MLLVEVFGREVWFHVQVMHSVMIVNCVIIFCAVNEYHILHYVRKFDN